MTKIKFCGLSRVCDIETVNELKPEYIGFVLWPESKRYVTAKKALSLKKILSPDIMAVGVFVDEDVKIIAEYLNAGIIDVAQLHGNEDEDYIKNLRSLTDKIIIKAFKIEHENDVTRAEKSSADYVMLDSGKGTGKTFSWSLIQNISRPYFLAGGLNLNNIESAIKILKPYAVDLSSGIETDGLKDKNKMSEFIKAVRKEQDK